jgi:hypothetical protein
MMARAMMNSSAVCMVALSGSLGRLSLARTAEGERAAAVSRTD